MKEEEKKSKTITSKKIGIAILLIVILVVVILIITPNDDDNTVNINQSTKEIQNIKKQVPEKGINLKKMDGLTFSYTQDMGDSIAYGYTPTGNNNFSVTMAVSDTDLKTHENSSYTLEQKIKDISDIEVKTAYKEEYIFKGTTMSQAYESLSFDFKYENKYYSGEISNLNGEPTKKELITILNKLILTFQN